MAGFFGFLRGDKAAGARPYVVAQLGQLMVPQRGRDVSRQAGDDYFGLFFCSHAYLSPQRGSQPLANEDRSIWAVCDGDIWNSAELHAQLSRQGHSFTSNLPAEVLVHLYEEIGDGMLDQMRGSYALAVVDRRAGRVLLARDHMGSKPLYFAMVNGDFLFASEIRPLLAAGAGGQVNPVAIHHFLTYGVVPSPMTMYAGIHRMRQASGCTWCPGAEPRVFTYWDYSFRPVTTLSETEIARKLHTLLLDSVERIVRSVDTQCGSTLSGGTDSTAVTGMLTEVVGKRVPTLFVGYDAAPGGLDDERDYARLAAKHYGTDHHELFVTSRDLLDALPRCVELLEQPTSTTMIEYFLSRLSARHVGFSLTGEAADSLFCGMSYYSVLAMLEQYRRLPGFVRKTLDTVMPHIPRYTRVFGKHPRIVYDVLSKADRASAAGRYYHLKRVFDEDEKRALYSPDMRQAVEGADTVAFTEMYFAGAQFVNTIEETLRVVQEREVPDMYLHDPLQTGEGTELRSPLVDRELVQFAASIPWHLKYRKGFQKYIFVQACRKYLPDAIVQRPKRGFTLGVFDAWLRQPEWTAVITSCLNPTSVRERNLFTWPEVEKILHRFLSGSEGYRRVWPLVMLELWYRRFVDGKHLEPGA